MSLDPIAVRYWTLVLLWALVAQLFLWAVLSIATNRRRGEALLGVLGLLLASLLAWCLVVATPELRALFVK